MRCLSFPSNLDKRIMEFNKRYNRAEFVSFLGSAFLPEDFMAETTDIKFERQTKYIRSITKLGKSEKLDLVVYEVRHTSAHDARVGLSKEAFRFLADEWENKALVLFIPENNDANYRFSLITIDLNETEEGKLQRIYSNPRRYSYYLGEGIAWYTPNKYLNSLGRVTDDKDLLDRFSVEVLTKAFYQELSDWYAWAVKEVRFPNKLDDRNDDDKYNSEAAIRLVTRLIFVWFLKQKHLIPEEFFDEEYIANNLLDDFKPNLQTGLFGHKSLESKYYKAILQNLFFAMLNSPITKEGENELSERHFRSGRGDYDNNKLMRYESMFKNPKLFIDLANNTVPFLNGGLFDCLDDKDNGNYVDGFSDREVIKKSLRVPDYLFFGEVAGKDIDLSEWYGDKKKKRVSARGIIDILKRYNFTVEENTPFDQEVSLDPELLGKVFENLLASYNPETQTTARKQTGSFYTPREIVQYMVDESLVAHLKRIVGEDLEAEYRKLISYVDEEIFLADEQKQQIMEAIYSCKVLDPACGSGAFPVGMLQQMVHILSQLDPTNEQWKNMMLEKAINESRHLEVESPEEFKERMKDIEDSFDENLNNPDYARKLYLVENCIYGVDIQPIAIQISKLRFFISLVVDQKTNTDPVNNFGIRPLPNLEAKFVAANTLIPLEKDESNLGRTPEIVEIENQLKEANHKIFSAKTVRTKRKWKKELIELRSKMAEKLADNGFLTTDAANQLASWDMFNQNTSSSFFDPDWMFGVKEGFDIVIGNPPYVNIEFISETDRSIYQNQYLCFVKRADLFSVFIECALSRMTGRNGLVTFIVPSVIHSNLSYQKLRNLLLDNHWLAESCYTGGDVFEGPTVDTTILRLDKKGVSDIVLKKALNFNAKTTSVVNADYFKAQNNIISIGDSSTNGLFDKLYSPVFPKLSDHFSVFQGIVTGNNPAFIFDSEKEALEKGIDKELLYPLCHGRDITRYEVRNRERRILYLNNDIDIDQYPSTELWLTSFKHHLLHRREAKKGTIKWYSLQWPRVKQELDIVEKIIVQNTRNESLKVRICATLDKEAVYGSQGVNFIIPTTGKVSLLYLLAILNSRLINYLFATKLLNLAIKAEYLKQLRVPTVIDTTRIFMEEIVNNILSAKQSNPLTDTTVLEEEIDLMVYKLYGLTYDEVLIVDPETSITSEEYKKKCGYE